MAARRARPEGGYPQLEGSATASNVTGECVATVTLNWDAELAGGVLILARDGHVIQSDDAYNGARDIRDAGPSPIAFTFTVNEGSGLYESRYVVLLALRRDSWVECFDAVARKLTIVSGEAPKGTPPADKMLEQRATLAIVGDTAFLAREVTYQKYRQAAQTETLGTSRFILPR